MRGLSAICKPRRQRADMLQQGKATGWAVQQERWCRAVCRQGDAPGATAALGPQGTAAGLWEQALATVSKLCWFYRSHTCVWSCANALRGPAGAVPGSPDVLGTDDNRRARPGIRRSTR